MTLGSRLRIPGFDPLPVAAMMPASGNRSEFPGRLDKESSMSAPEPTTATPLDWGLAAADVFTASTTFWVMESVRLDLGYGSQVHP
jgi:hypothetical protein